MTNIVTLTVNPAIDKSVRVDKVVAEHKLRCEEPRYDPGGGGINVSRVISRLGGKSLAIYTAGGPPGEMFKTLLKDWQIEQKTIPIGQWTRQNFTAQEMSSGQQYRFGMPGPTLSEKEWRACLDALEDLDFKPEYIVASGSLPPGVPKEFYVHAAGTANRIGAKMIIDTSGPALKAALVEHGAYLIKPNLRELGQLGDEDIVEESQQEKIARKLIDSGMAEVVVVSRGANGALLVCKEAVEHFRAPTVPIQSKVGAGDSMVGGIVYALTNGKGIGDAVRFGIAAGAATVKTPGTELCHREDVVSLYESMR